MTAKLSGAEIAALDYCLTHPTIYAGNVKGVGSGKLWKLVRLGYLEQNPFSPMGNFRITLRGRDYMGAGYAITHE